jgi:hypothetical protein
MNRYLVKCTQNKFKNKISKKQSKINQNKKNSYVKDYFFYPKI